VSSLRPPSRSTLSRLVLPLAVTLLALPLAACGSDSSADAADPDPTTSEEAFEPVSIEHAFGSTEITEKPERVATWGWGSPDAVLALGVVPVAMEALTYGANDEGFMPWQAKAFEELGETPVALTPGEAPPFEEIAAAAPDVILANYSGITEADYEKLSKIAPTVAYPDQPWSTPWRDVITTVGEALGEADEAAQVLEDIDAEVAAAAAEHPEFEGKTIAAVAIDPSAFYVYRGADPRVQFLEDLGFTLAPSVDELDTEESTFYYTISTENVDKLTSDVLLSYAADQARADEIAADPTYQTMEQFADGRVAHVVGEDIVSSVSPPTALSLTYSLDTFVDALAAAVPAS
jgi:iron complex transport system substrate-binding protein